MYQKEVKLTLGQLIDELKEFDPDDRIIAYTPACEDVVIPGGFHSYRGIYAHLGLGTVSSERTVGEFLKECEEQVGSTHEGYKGGDYTMDEETPVWWSMDSGHYSQAGIVGIEEVEHEVSGCIALRTAEVGHYAQMW